MPPSLPMITHPLYFWFLFNGGVLFLLFIDLFLLHRGEKTVSWKEALGTTLVWIALAAAFGGWITWRDGSAKGLEFATGYLIEYSLSLDNIFVFVLVFSSFKVAPQFQHRLLFWGVLGALVMRGVMVLVGTELLLRFEWIIYIFGLYLIYAGSAMLFHKEEADSIEHSRVVRWARRWLPLSSQPADGRFVVREEGKLHFTILFLVLVVIEFSDLIFALDSIPAVFGVTKDPFIVYTSNVCAILGLRSLYFLLAGAVQHLRYLRPGLAAVLIFVGAKMLGEKLLHISSPVSLAVIGTILAVAIGASLLHRDRPKEPDAPSQ